MKIKSFIGKAKPFRYIGRHSRFTVRRRQIRTCLITKMIGGLASA